MNLIDMEMLIRDIFPNCTFDEDNYGQIVIYTDMMVEGDTLVNLEEE